MAVNENGLTDMQVRFCHEYIIDMNASQAGIRAGYNYSSGRRLFKQPNVRAYVNALQAEALRRASITADRVLSEYARIAFADVRKILAPNEPYA